MLKRRSFYWLAVVNSWLRCLSTASRFVKLMWLLCRPQGIWALGWTPTWICLLIFPKLAAAPFTIFITSVISGSSSQGRILNSWFMPSSQVDWTNCISLLYGVPDCQIMKLQRVMNVSARLIYCAPKFCRITPILMELHWLPVRARIEFKILLITFKVIKGLAPKYLSDLIAILPSSNYDLRRNSNGIHLLRSTLRTKKTLVTARSRLQHQYYGIVCLYQLDKQVLSTILRDQLRLIYLLRRIINLSYFACFYHYFYTCCLLFLLIVHSFYNSIEHEIIVMKKHRIWF